MQSSSLACVLIFPAFIVPDAVFSVKQTLFASLCSEWFHLASLYTSYNSHALSLCIVIFYPAVGPLEAFCQLKLAAQKGWQPKIRHAGCLSPLLSLFYWSSAPPFVPPSISTSHHISSSSLQTTLIGSSGGGLPLSN